MKKLELPIGTVIPRGYIVGITSWENDGDYYHTIYHTGLTRDDVDFFRVIAPFFNSANDWKEPGYGNDPYTDALVFELFDKLEENPHMANQFKRFLDIDCNVIDEEEGVPNWVTILETIKKNITHEATYYDGDFIRVVESIDVWFIHDEFEIEEIPANFVESIK
ncbi:hypothetical protein [Aeromonas phage AS-yj]|uniref:Uncharacterized protein n=1 Tax=Aeromonas phage AS-yj TaxID=2026115 RepID=A0A291LEF6_9CAUD|nr:hypothetical protein [Aeromonas phage AS-yj]